MECSETESGWFEFKAFVTNGGKFQVIDYK